MDLSVIIVSYNHYDLLKPCIESIYKYNDIGADLEIIVSDNSPNTEIIKAISRDFPQVKTVKNDNIGFGPGNNKGVKISRGKYLLFLNPDTLLIEPIFKFAIEKFKNHKNLVAFNVKLLKANKADATSFLLLDNNNILENYLYKKICLPNDIFIDKKMSLIGADLFIRRDVFINAGMFDENIFMYCEEGDLEKRIFNLSNQYKTGYFKDKRIIHLEGGTEEKNTLSSLSQLKRTMDSYMYYCHKWNLNFVKEVNKMIRFNRLKLIQAKMKRKPDQIAYYNNMISIYDEYVQLYESKYLS